MRGGVAKVNASVSKPTFGFVLVIPPVWQTLHVLKNKRFPRFNCSGVIVTFFDGFNGIVNVASSN